MKQYDTLTKPEKNLYNTIDRNFMENKKITKRMFVQILKMLICKHG